MVFVVPGSITEYWLVSSGYFLVYLVFAFGFVLITPFVLSGYYRVPEMLKQGRGMGFSGIVNAVVTNPLPVWILGMISFAIYLIWISVALIIYGVYLGLEPLSGQLSNPGVSAAAIRFAAITGLLGLVHALAVFAITVFSVPHAIFNGSGLANCVAFSVRAVFGNLAVMFGWAFVLGGLCLLSLVLFPPAALVVLPVLCYANEAGYQEWSRCLASA